MKHTKKMLMVPEVEYLTLLSMVKGEDSLGTEKAQTDVEIKKTLNDPKIGEDLKAKRYNWLYKKRRQLKGEIENRPQKVIVVPSASGGTAAPPYVNAAKPPPPAAPVVLQTDSEYETASPLVTPVVTKSKRRRAARAQTRTPSASPFKAIISRNYAPRLHHYVEENAEKFKIFDDGKFESNIRGKKIKESNYRQVIDYLTGEAPSPGKGFTFLYNRLTKDPQIKEMIANSKKESAGTSNTNYGSSSGDYESSSGGGQSGKGARKKRKVHVVVKKGAFKAANISPKRGVKFSPRIWEKL